MFGLATTLTAAYMIIIFVLSLLGNLTTIIAIWTYHELQNTTYYYILNLAIADLLMSFTMPMKIFLIFEYEELLCKASMFLTIFFFHASVLAIYIIALDRYIFICKPLYYRTHPISTKIHAWITLAWIFALIISVIPFTKLADAGDDKNGRICKYSSVMSSSYLAFLITITELLPPLVFVVMYGRIIAVARRHAIEIAIQFTNSKPFTMDWLQRRKLTESLVSPFENPSYLLDKLAGKDENEQAKAIRKILYKNYTAWRMKQAELRKKSELEDNVEENEVFKSDEQEVPKENLSKVGHGLHKWKIKALSVSFDPMLNDADDDQVKDAHKSRLASVCTKKPKVISVSSIDNLINADNERENKNNQTQPTRSLKQRLFQYCCSKFQTSAEKMDGRSKWQLTRRIFTVFSKPKQNKTTKLKIRKEFKAVKMLGLVVGMFIILNVPIGILDMLQISKTMIKIPSWIVKVALCLANSNPAVNPMIYVITRRQFRLAYLRLWSCGRYQPRLSESSC